jgi:hypothetical protein
MSKKEIEQIEDINLQDELVEDVEVSDEELAEASAPAEVDGEKAAETTAKAVKASAPGQAAAPKTKAGIIAAVNTKMSKMKKEELSSAFGGMLEGLEADDSVESVFEDDLNALADSEATLSEGFKDKAAVIFEAALKSKLSEHVERLEEQYAEELAEETARVKNDLVEKVDGYLSYVVEQWMEDNKLAVETGLRTEIAESFMSQLHQVFVEHYIEVPESKVDLVDQLSAKVEELEEQVSTHVDANIELKESVKVLKRDAIIRESSAGLSESQAEKLKSLVEGIDFESAESFEEKVATIKESYFKQAKAEAISEDMQVSGEDEEVRQVSPMMQSYLNALKIK